MPLMNNISGGLISIKKEHLLKKPVCFDCERLPERVVQPALSGSTNINMIYPVSIISLFYLGCFLRSL